MSSYLLLKTIHIAATSLYLGVSVANGYAKTRADRHRDAGASALALDVVCSQNRIFLVPASVVLLATRLGMAHLTGLPLTRGGLLASSSCSRVCRCCSVWPCAWKGACRPLPKRLGERGQPCPKPTGG